jgi:hypothetical protein
MMSRGGTGILNKAVTGAMSRQLERVNGKGQGMHENARVAQLQSLLQSRDEQLSAAFEEIDRLIADRADCFKGLRWNGRPVISPEEATVRVGLSIATVNRYCNSGHWAAIQQSGSNRWLIFADQPLNPKKG